MAVQDWLALFGGIVIVAFIVFAFRKGDKVKSIQQPDNWQNYDGGIGGGHNGSP